MSTREELQRQLSAAHSEALQVGDSPLRADQLAARLPGLVRMVDQAGLEESDRRRVQEALSSAERVLRRDDDGRDAARHLQTAISVVGLPPRKPSPFLDDLPA